MNKTTMIKSAAFALLFLAALSLPAGAIAQGTGIGEAEHLFFRANAAYKQGDYDAAIADYEKIGGLGLESGNLYYNLGNSYFKKGEAGKAVFYYESARFFIPSDSDLRSNYEYVLSSLNLGKQSFGNRFQRFCGRLYEGVNMDFLTVLLSIIYVLAVIFLISNLYFGWIRGISKFIFPALAVIFIISFTALYGKITYFNKGAIVISLNADVKFEPLEQATTYFKLGAGSKVEIIDKTQDWYKIKRPDRKVGWINKELVQAFDAGNLQG